MKNKLARHLCTKLTVLMVCFLTVMLVATSVSAETNYPKRGISAQLQDDQMDILIPFRWERFTLAPVFSVASVSDVVIDFGVGVAYRYHLKTGKAIPYVGLRAAVFVMTPEGGDSITDYAVGPSVGGEYFLDDHFSLAVEAQVNVSFSDESSFRFGNPDGTNVNTATSIVATFYF